MKRADILKGIAALPLVGPLLSGTVPKVGATVYSADGVILDRFLYSAESKGVLWREMLERIEHCEVGSVVRFSESMGKYGTTTLTKLSDSISSNGIR